MEFILFIIDLIFLGSLGYLIYAFIKKKPKKKAGIVLGISFLLLVILGTISAKDNTKNKTAKIEDKKEVNTEKENKINLTKIAKDLEVFSVFLNKEGNALKIYVAPKFELSNKPKAYNIASSIAYLGDYLCEADINPATGVELIIGWRDAANNQHKSLLLKGVLADLCNGYDNAKEEDSNIKKGYILMNNFYSFPEKKILSQEDFQTICSNENIQKFCNEF